MKINSQKLDNFLISRAELINLWMYLLIFRGYKKIGTLFRNGLTQVYYCMLVRNEKKIIHWIPSFARTYFVEQNSSS